MRKIFLLSGLLLVIACSFSAFAQQKKQIQITGKVEFLNPEIFKKYNLVWLQKGIGANLITIDSAQIGSDGTFSFTLDSQPALYHLDIVKWQTVSFWADENIRIASRGYDTARVKSRNSGYITIESSSDANQLINTATYGKYLDKKLLAEVAAEGYAAQRNMKTDSAWVKFYVKQNLYRQIEAQSDERIKGLVRSFPQNPASVYLLSLIDWKKDPNYVLAELDKRIAAKPDFQEALALKKEIQTDLATQKATQSGSYIPEIAYPGVDGKTIPLRSFRGKYVIVDFWASWCGPCRKSIPKIKELYNLYHSKGLEVLSISIDTDNAAWRKAMTDEQMPWSQVVSPNKDKTLKDFNIQGVPTLFLIDKEGRIIEKFTGYSPRLEDLLKSKIGR